MEREEKIIREVFRRWNDGEWTIDPGLIHPDVELHSALTNSVWRGQAGVQAWIDEISEQFDTWTLGLDGLRRVAPGHWLGLGEIHARGKSSGLDIDQRAGWIFRFRDERLDRLQTFVSHAEAEAVAEALQAEDRRA